jgi:hypothetical protein
MGIPADAPPDASVVRGAYRGYTQTSNYREHTREYNCGMVFTSRNVDIKSSPGNGSCFQIYHLVSPLHSNEANRRTYGQVHIFVSAEAVTKWLENQTTQGCMAKVIQ